jgi:hypothetical protein
VAYSGNNMMKTQQKDQDKNYTNFIVFGLTWPGLKSTINWIRGEHDNYNTTC